MTVEFGPVTFIERELGKDLLMASMNSRKD